ncbi:hypothetical protein WR25_02261 [Diploscapter pachys]|uniref:Uncharacterized protein n=1 Tax=Diploscapter pachys TaxID=2018661 RepID=A0A2A2KA79_9BILA|nr:hypothetical protein WR25_02261 [Diploscapter pachys]
MDEENSEEVTNPENEENPDEPRALDGPFLIMPYERDLLLETMDKDVLFISALGLGMERLFLEHLIMFSTKKTLALVLNTNQLDEDYFISQLRKAQVPCEPKILTAEVLGKDREAIYLEGGCQFITSRILIVDLLTGRIPIQNVACIFVYRAHKVLFSFQESFILRLYREKKKDGMVKAFSDVPTSSISCFGQLQRAIDRLYVKVVKFVPRFDDNIKHSIDDNACRLSIIDVSMPDSLRRIQRSLCEIITVCLKDLKQCSISGAQSGEEHNETGLRAVWHESSLERRLGDRMCYLNDKQKRLLTDLVLLRALLKISEGMDVVTLLTKLNIIRNDKEMAQSSNWLMSTTAKKLIADVESLCTTTGGETKRLIIGPPKWKVLAEILEEIKTIPVQRHEVPETGPSVLIMASSEELCKQLQDLIKSGEENLMWRVTRQHDRGYLGTEPDLQPLWNPEHVKMLYRAQRKDESTSDLRDKVQKEQKTIARAAQRKRKAVETLFTSSNDGLKQTRLLQFGILQYKKRKNERIVDRFYTATLSFPSVLLGAKNSSWISESEETPAKMVTSLVRVRNWRMKALPTGVPDGTTGALRSRERTDRTCKLVGEF